MRLKLFIVVTAIAAAMHASADADVVLQKKTTIDNLFGLGGSTTTETEFIKPDRFYSESQTKFDSKLMRLASGGKEAKAGSIVRLDKGIMQSLDFNTKTYTEMDLNFLKTMSDSISETMSQTQPPPGEEVSQQQMPDEQEYEWTFDVKTDEKNVDVNGFSCKHVTAKGLGVNKQDSTKKLIMTTEEWLTEDAAGLDQVRAYEENYAKMLGMDAKESQQALGNAFQGYGKQMAELAEKLKDVKGYPIKTVFTMETTAPRDDQTVDENETTEQSDDQNEAAQQALKKLGGMFGKKKDKDKKAEEPKNEGFTKMFSATTEILSVKTSDVADSQFEIPSGFAKKTE